MPAPVRRCSSITSVSQIGGDIAGAATGDFIDLQFQTFASGDEVVWQQNGSTGTLTLETSGGWTQLTLAGTYTSANFTAVADSHGGTLIEVVNTADPQPANTTANMILERKSPMALTRFTISAATRS